MKSYSIKKKDNEIDKEIAYLKWRIKQNNKIIKGYEKSHHIKKSKVTKL